MNEKICYVVGAGDFFDPVFSPASEDLVIAVDGGYRHLSDRGIPIGLVLGDFDSLPLIPKHPNIIRLNQEKNDTDMLVALKEGLGRGYTLFHIYGGTGGRFEHTFANIQCLAYLSQNGAQGFLFGKDEIITAITDSCAEFDETQKGYLSVFAFSEKAEGVFESGLKYALDNATLSNVFPLGVSNEFNGAKSRVSVRKGTLIMIYHQAQSES